MRVLPTILLCLAVFAVADRTDLTERTCSDVTCAEVKMIYRRLGRSGLYVSALSYGAWISFANQINDDQAFQIMKAAFNGGINFFDNAETYADGAAEAVMGKAIQRGINESVWKRSDLVVSTKIFWGGKGPNDVGLSRKHIIEGLTQSLERLQLKYVDIVFAHRYDPHTPMEEIVRAFNWHIQQGHALYWGTSEWQSSEIEQAWAVADKLGLIGPVAEQPQYNLLHRERVEVEYLPLYHSRGLGTTIFSPLASGVLTGKYNHGIPSTARLSVPAAQWLKDAMLSGKRHGNWDDVLRSVRHVEVLADELGCTAAQLALAWCIKNNHVSTVLFGATTVEQVTENIRALHVLPKLTSSILDRLDQVFEVPEKPYDWTSRKK